MPDMTIHYKQFPNEAFYKKIWIKPCGSVLTSIQKLTADKNLPAPNWSLRPKTPRQPPFSPTAMALVGTRES